MMRFVKMQGVGNDFVVIAAEDAAGRDLPALARSVCARGFGIGADGLLVVGRGSGAFAFTFRMFNPDGSEDMCGNGMRCACLLAYEQGWIGFDSVLASTKDGPRRCRLLSVSEDGKRAIVEVDMGAPRFDPEELPFVSTETKGPILASIEVNGHVHRLVIVNTGSTHSVIFGDGPPSDERFFGDSPLIENHPLFLERTSIMWAWRTGDARFSIRIWERGAGETLGCGTGACAVGVAAQLKGLSAPGVETVIVSKGGELTIQWAGFKAHGAIVFAESAAGIPVDYLYSAPMHFFDAPRMSVQDTESNTTQLGQQVRNSQDADTGQENLSVLMTGPAMRVFEGELL